MKDTWEKQSNLVDKVNILWKDVQTIWARLEERRDEAALVLQEVLNKMTEAAAKAHTSTEIRVVPVVEAGLMTGVRVWVGKTCHLYKTKEVLNVSEQEVHVVEADKLDGNAENGDVGYTGPKLVKKAKGRSK